MVSATSSRTHSAPYVEITFRTLPQQSNLIPSYFRVIFSPLYWLVLANSFIGFMRRVHFPNERLGWVGALACCGRVFFKPRAISSSVLQHKRLWWFRVGCWRSAAVLAAVWSGNCGSLLKHCQQHQGNNDYNMINSRSPAPSCVQFSLQLQKKHALVMIVGGLPVCSS